MGKSSNRRRNRRLKYIQFLRQTNCELFKEEGGRLLEQWRRQVEFRARHFRYRDGHLVPEVWDLFRKKRCEAVELEVEEDLRELCRRAIARQIGTGKINLGLSVHFPVRNHIERELQMGSSAAR